MRALMIPASETFLCWSILAFTVKGLSDRVDVQLYLVLWTNAPQNNIQGAGISFFFVLFRRTYAQSAPRFPTKETNAAIRMRLEWWGGPQPSWEPTSLSAAVAPAWAVNSCGCQGRRPSLAWVPGRQRPVPKTSPPQHWTGDHSAGFSTQLGGELSSVIAQGSVPSMHPPAVEPAWGRALPSSFSAW
jgi:hypothetical protein